jgi:hypothetical protein
MIGWLNPAAFVGLALLVLPVLVHLLRTHRAERIMFPSIRFVTPSRTAAVRLRPPTDPLLLLVRLAIAALAVVALARPVFVTAARQRAWNGRTARAIVIDASAAMRVGDAAGKRPEDERARAAPPKSARRPGRRMTAPSSAMAWSGRWGGSPRAAGAARDRGDLRVHRWRFREAMSRMCPPVSASGWCASAAGRDRAGDGSVWFAAPGSSRNRQEILLTGPKNGVTAVPEALSQSGLRLVGVDPGSGAVQRLWRAVAAAGAPSPSADQPLACQFGSNAAGPLPAPIDRTTPRWMLRTLLRLQNDRSLQEAGRSVAVRRSRHPILDGGVSETPVVRSSAPPRHNASSCCRSARRQTASSPPRRFERCWWSAAATATSRAGNPANAAATLAAWSARGEIDHDLWRRPIDRRPLVLGRACCCSARGAASRRSSRDAGRGADAA